MNRLLLAAAFAGGIAVAAVGWLLWPKEPAARSAAELMDALMWNREPVGGPFALIDHTGRPRTDADFRGKLLLIYFGFTYCSDICPADLLSIGTAIERLGKGGEAIQPLFITIDPEKDTPAQLASYVGNFHPRLIGLTGTPKEIRRVALAYKVYYAKVDGTESPALSIEHTSFIYLFDTNGRYRGFFPPGTPAERMIEIIRPHLGAISPP
jgi:cytochrome oxidase Cu insertion factor (SCO1/SenC/PrrC family)